jgi:hypothetical protein
MSTINEHKYGYAPIKKVTRIDILNNTTLANAFEAKRKALEKSNDANELFVFHGTPKESNINSISRHNFDATIIGKTTGNKGWYGSGIYLTEHAGAALRYQHWNTKDAPNRMLVCRVMLGRAFSIPEDSKDYIGADATPGYHSHKGRDKWDLDWQLVLFDTAHILPFAHVHYE